MFAAGNQLHRVGTNGAEWSTNLNNQNAKTTADKNFEFFKFNFHQFYNEHPNKFIILKHGAVISVYDTFDKEYTEIIKTEPLGTSLIQQCSSEDDSAEHFNSDNVNF